MKKLMIAAAVAAVGLGASALESANVVGYDQANLRGGNAAIGLGASFVNVDDSDLTLGDVTVTGYEEAYDEGQIIAKQLNGYGIGGTSYYWYDFEDGGDVWYGWYNSDGDVEYSDVALPAGEGLWIYSPSAEYKLQSSGAVPTAPVAVTLRGGNAAKLVANPMPVTLTLGDINVTGYEEAYDEGQIVAKKLNGYGIGGTSYYWYDFEDGGDVWYGWYNSDGDVEYNDVTLAPGESLWIYSPSTDYSVVFPAPVL